MKKSPHNIEFKKMAPFAKSRYPLIVALAYALAGAAWIFFSDELLHQFTGDPGMFAGIAALKGWMFVGLTTVALFLVTRGVLGSMTSRDERIRKNEKFLGDILGSLRDGIVILDRDKTIVRSNPVADRWFPGSAPLVGKKCLDAGQSGAACKDCVDTALETGREGRTLIPPGTRGSDRWVELCCYPLIDSATGGIMGAIEYLRDVTAGKRAEEALEHSEEKYRTIFNAANDAMFIADEKGVIMEVNGKAEELAGRPAGQLVGRPHTVLHPAQEDMRYRRILLAALEDGRPISGDIYVERGDGSRVPVEMSASIAEFGGGKAMIGVLRDISHGQAAEARIREQLDMLTALYSGAQKFSQSLDLAELAHSAVFTSVSSFQARFAWIGAVEPGGRLRLLAHYPEIPEFKRLVTLRWDEPEAGFSPGKAVKNGVPVVAEDLAKEKSAAPWLKDALSEGLRTGASFTLTSREKTIGALTLFSERPGFFTRERVRFFQAYAHQAAASFENARLHEETEHRLDRLNALCSIDTAITQSLDLRVIFDVLLDRVITQLKVDAADILLMDPNTMILNWAAGSGFRTRSVRETAQRLGEGNAGHSALQRRIIGVENISETIDDRAHAFAQEGFISYYAAPLITKGQILGVLELFHRSRLSTDREWMDFLGMMASQAAIAIENAGLFDNLQRTNTELALAYDTTLEGWSRALDLRDRETEGHTTRVTGLSLKLARAVGMSEPALLHMRRGALLHDIGKMGIPDSILLKPGPLTEEEMKVMRRHPVYALDLLQPIAYLRPALPIPYLHHERWDGTGYPKGLRGEQIPLAARLFAVADVWDALRSERPYRPPWPPERVMRHMQSRAGTHFDPKIVDKFMELVGSGVES